APFKTGTPTPLATPASAAAQLAFLQLPSTKQYLSWLGNGNISPANNTPDQNIALGFVACPTCAARIVAQYLAGQRGNGIARGYNDILNAPALLAGVAAPGKIGFNYNPLPARLR